MLPHELNGLQQELQLSKAPLQPQLFELSLQELQLSQLLFEQPHRLRLLQNIAIFLI